jgi:translation initiation factor 5B
VIDIQHGLEKQTLESMKLLARNKTPFVVALNKIDRSYGWRKEEDGCSYLSLKRQTSTAFNDYETKLRKVKLELNEKGYNAALYWENDDPEDFISLVPTSGVTGEGIPDLLAMLVHTCMNSPKVAEKLIVRKDRFKCTVM